MDLMRLDQGVADKPLTESRLRWIAPIERFATLFCALIFAFTVMFSLQQLAQVRTLNSFILAWSISLISASAAFALGGILGFLFGIPRSLQKSSPPTASNVAPMVSEDAHDDANKPKSSKLYTTNTSLEEISDWLTKIIIGIGLVQFDKILNYLYKSALFCASLVSGVSVNLGVLEKEIYNPNVPLPYFYSLILASSIGGCFFVYLETRTRLTLIFVGAERQMSEDDTSQELVRAAERPISTPAQGGASRIKSAGVTEPPDQEDVKVTKIPRESIKSPTALVGWASAQARSKNYQVAEDAFRDALQREPENDDLRLRISDVRFFRGNYAGALEMALEAANRTKDTSVKQKSLKRAIYISLYNSPPIGFESAIKLSGNFRSFKSSDTYVEIWRAAAFGQKYKWLTQNAGSKDALEQARKGALQAVAEVVRLRPDSKDEERNVLHAIFDPTDEQIMSGEDDLRVFRDDEDFKKLIE